MHRTAPQFPRAPGSYVAVIALLAMIPGTVQLSQRRGVALRGSTRTLASPTVVMAFPIPDGVLDDGASFTP